MHTFFLIIISLVFGGLVFLISYLWSINRMLIKKLDLLSSQLVVLQEKASVNADIILSNSDNSTFLSAAAVAGISVLSIFVIYIIFFGGSSGGGGNADLILNQVNSHSEALSNQIDSSFSLVVSKLDSASLLSMATAKSAITVEDIVVKAFGL